MKGLALVAALFSVLLAGCGGGGGDGISAGENRLGGLWHGTVDPEDGAPEQHIALITESGYAYIMQNDESSIAIGQFSTSGNNFSARFTEYDDVDIVTGTLAGTFTVQSMFDGSATVDGEEVSTFSFTYDDTYERGSDLADLAGTYSDSEPGYSETYTIATNGTVTGSNSNGCTITGAFSIIDLDFNDYRATLTVQNCDDANGTYRGHAVLTDSDDLLLFAEGPEYFIGGYVNRNTDT